LNLNPPEDSADIHNPTRDDKPRNFNLSEFANMPQFR
jgi:hypothetical protein